MPELTVFSALRGGVAKAAPRTLSGVNDGNRGWHTLFETHPGGWQQDVHIDRDSVLENPTVYACESLISGDIAKLRCMLMEKQASGIWQETNSPAFSPVLRKPNAYQTWQQFVEQWVLSKLGPRGNTYILKERDNRGVVVALYVLDPHRVRPLVANDGSVFYELQEDYLSRVTEPEMAVPASEIIHDRQNCFFHPLVGLSPLFAAALPAWQGLKINTNSAKFFENMSRPGGILSAAGQISDETARRLKEHWEKNYNGASLGKIAVLGDGLKFEAMAQTAHDAELVGQLGMTAKQIAACFHVPPHLVGAADQPATQSEEAIGLRYYSQCLQRLIEAIENCLDEGLGLANVPGRTLGTQLDIDGLLRMDSGALTASLKEQVGAGITKIDEARLRLNYAPVEGGDTPYLQQQNYSLAALAKRDSLPNPFVMDKPTSNPTPSPGGPAATADPSKDIEALLTKALDDMRAAGQASANDAVAAAVQEARADAAADQLKKAEADMATLLEAFSEEFADA